MTESGRNARFSLCPRDLKPQRGGLIALQGVYFVAKKILIVGGGYAGFYTAWGLE